MFRIPNGLVVTRIVAACLAALLVYACVTNGIATRFARTDPEQALRFAPNHSTALSVLGQVRLLQARDPSKVGEVIIPNWRAIERSPYEAASLRTLGMIDAAIGRDEQALQKISVAGRLTLRDAFAHGWLLNRAYKYNQIKPTLYEADIVLKQNTATWNTVLPALTKILPQPGVIDTLAGLLAKNPIWRSTFLDTLPENGGDASATYRLLEALRRTKSPPTNQEMTSFFSSGASHVAPPELYRQWLSLLPADVSIANKAAPLRDGGFDGMAAPPPFTWWLANTQSGAAFAELSSPPDKNKGKSLYLASDGSEQRVLAYQIAVLKPGKYRITADAYGERSTDDGRFVLYLRCPSHAVLNQVALKAPLDQWSRINADFDVTASCTGVFVEFQSAKTAGNDAGGIWIDNIAIAPVR